MELYHKIETLFKREDFGKHKLLIGEYRNPTVEQCKNLEWMFTEKIDGTNIRIYWDGHKVSFNGRTDNAQLHKDLFQYLHDTFCTSEVEQVFEQNFGEKEVYLFGEGYGAGIQKGGGYRKDKSFILFDVKIDGYFLSHQDMQGIANIFEVDVVPVVLTGTIDEAIEYVKTNEFSVVGDGTQPHEGLVGRLKEEMFDRFGNRMIVKIKRENIN